MKTLILAAFAAITAVAHADAPLVLKHTIPGPPPGGQPDAHFGSSVAVDGDYAVVGVPDDNTDAPNSGVVKVFDSLTGTQLFLLPNPSPAAGDRFGSAVAISGRRVVVGSAADGAYVYDLNSATTPTVPVLTLNRPGVIFPINSVAISGTRVVVGIPGDDTGARLAGSAFVYDLSSATPAVPVATLNNPSPEEFDFFGFAVAISGTRVVVGTPFDFRGGSAYVYDMSSGTPTVPIATLDNVGNDQFGHSVAISGTRLVVGARKDSTRVEHWGSAYVYDLTSITPTVPVTTLNNPEPAEYDFFGHSVAISGTRVVVGAPPETQGLAGGSYVYDLSSATPSVPVATLNNPSHALDDNFGYSVAISGTQIVVGALYDDTGATNTGIAYRYDISSPTPTAPTTNLYSFDLREIGAFGTTAVISGTRVVVGTYGDSGDSVGKVYAFDQSSVTPLVPVELNGDFWGENFGRSLAISGSRLVVGATAGFGGPGHAYVYDLNSATPSVPVITLTSNNPDFGYSVAISGTRVVIGNYGSVSNGGGNAFVYDLVSATPTVPVSTLNNPTGQ